MKSKNEIIKNFFIRDKILGNLAKNRPLPSLDIYGRKGPFLALLEAIISQQLSSKVADSLYQRFEHFISGEIDIPRYLSKREINELRNVGISRAKAECIIELSRMVQKREIKFESLNQKTDEAITETLTKVKGIGVWTVNMFLIFGLKREDVWPFTDFGIRKNLTKILGKREILSISETEKIGERWKPYRSYASCYIWKN